MSDDDAGTSRPDPGFPDPGYPDPDFPAPDFPAPDFPAARLGREGYRTAEVDAFVGQLVRALRNDPPTMAPDEVVAQRFKVTRFGQGYDLRAVDDYLDEAERLLRDRRGDRDVEDGSTALAGQPPPKHVHTGWIYLVALVLVAIIIGITLTQL